MICSHESKLPSKNIAEINVKEYSALKRSKDSSECFSFEKHSGFTVIKSATGYSYVKVLFDNQVSKTRLEDNQYNKYEIQDNPNTIVLESNQRLQGYPGKIKSIIVQGDDLNGKNSYRN